MGTRKRDIPEINAGSMADIAFLLLVFFLVTTTMDIQAGLNVALPPITDVPPPQTKQKKREVLEVLINASDQLLVEGAPMTIDKLKETTVDHLSNNGRSEKYSTSPKNAIVSLKNDRGTSYDMYVQVYNELTAGYNQVRNDYAEAKYNKTYTELRESKKESDKLRVKEIQKAIPRKLSEAEPVSIGK